MRRSTARSAERPYSCLLHVHEYGLSAVDLGVLQKMAEVAAAAHTPLLSAASPQLFGLGSFTDLPLPRDLHKIFQSADYIEWRSFREKDDSRYVTLCLPHLLMRLPYGNDTDPVETFVYEEDVAGAVPRPLPLGQRGFRPCRVHHGGLCQVRLDGGDPGL